MKVLDLFAGLEGWSAPFRERGHEVLSLDNDPRFGCDVTSDILTWRYTDLPWKPDIILASPPCEKFSTMAFSSGYFRMTGDKDAGTERYFPARAEAATAMALVLRAVDLIRKLEPRFAVIENPRGLLRRLDIIPYPRSTVWYCHYGQNRGKPTDLWVHGNLPVKFYPICHNRRSGHPKGCCCTDHAAAPRGSYTGTQGMDRYEAAKIPRLLASQVCLAAERGMT